MTSPDAAAPPAPPPAASADTLVINAGSSSIKADVVDARDGRRRISLRVERVRTDGAFWRWDGGPPEALGRRDHAEALELAMPRLLAAAVGDVAVVGHRVVHGGPRFVDPTLLDDATVDALRALIPLAPLHNPANVQGIEAARRLLPRADHVAVFDTGFHQTLPRHAYTYALPWELSERHGLRRYGFHGISHAFVAHEAATYLGRDLGTMRMVTCHLGNGASLAAIDRGSSIDTTMGMTPLEGLAMGTRCGDVDPGMILDLVRRGVYDVEEMARVLNFGSGLAGMSGVGNDLRDIEARAAAGDPRCALALAVYCHKITRLLGGMIASLGAVDAIVFTGGVGENSATVRARVCAQLGFCGAVLDAAANDAARPQRSQPVVALGAAASRVALLAVATDEERAIARDAHALVQTRHLMPKA